MNDYAVPLSGVDALHAHFAEWIRFLDAKGLELEAQLAKLEARKARAAASETTPSSGSQVDLRGSGYLEIAFGDQGITTQSEGGAAAADAEEALQGVNVLPNEMTDSESGGQESEEASEPPQVENRAPTETPNPANSDEPILDSEGNMP